MVNIYIRRTIAGSFRSPNKAKKLTEHGEGLWGVFEAMRKRQARWRQLLGTVAANPIVLPPRLIAGDIFANVGKILFRESKQSD